MSPYGVAKAHAYDKVAQHRAAQGGYAVSGVLFNHESPLRPETFVTRKIVRAATRIAGGSTEKLVLGNLDIERDWGWAPEYVEAMHLMVQQDRPDDFVIATGHSSTLRDFTAAVFAAVGLDWRDRVESSPDLYRPAELLLSRAATGAPTSGSAGADARPPPWRRNWSNASGRAHGDDPAVHTLALPVDSGPVWPDNIFPEARPKGCVDDAEDR